MNLDGFYSELTLKTHAKLALIVLDGLGDIATKAQGEVTPLEAASTPNLDALAASGVAQGRMIPVVPGITPGSGPGHLALLGYDPLEFQVGRGVIEALPRALGGDDYPSPPIDEQLVRRYLERIEAASSSEATEQATEAAIA